MYECYLEEKGVLPKRNKGVSYKKKAWSQKNFPGAPPPDPLLPLSPPTFWRLVPPLGAPKYDDSISLGMPPISTSNFMNLGNSVYSRDGAREEILGRKTVRMLTASEGSKIFYGPHLSDWLKMRLHSLKI